jgi:hypothetical protein
MNPPHCLLTFSLLLPVAATPLLAQNLPRVGRVEAHSYQSPWLDNAGATAAVVHEHVVRVTAATFLSLELRDVVLREGSLLEVRSLRDDEAEFYTPELLAERRWTAYFNGDAVRVRLWAAAGTRGNRFGLGRLAIGGAAAGGRPLSLCNANDTRTLSYDLRVCRLLINDGANLYVGTAWLLDYKGVVLTAGHNRATSVFGTPFSFSIAIVIRHLSSSLVTAVDLPHGMVHGVRDNATPS